MELKKSLLANIIVILLMLAIVIWLRTGRNATGGNDQNASVREGVGAGK